MPRPMGADRPEVARIFPTLPTAGPGADAWMNYNKHSIEGKEYRAHPPDDADFGLWSHFAFPSDGSKILNLNTGRLLVGRSKGTHYPTLEVNTDEKKRSICIHRSVAFLYGAPNNSGFPMSLNLVVDHIVENDKLNYTASNLQLLGFAENTRKWHLNNQATAPPLPLPQTQTPQTQMQTLLQQPQMQTPLQQTQTQTPLQQTQTQTPPQQTQMQTPPQPSLALGRTKRAPRVTSFPEMDEEEEDEDEKGSEDSNEDAEFDEEEDSDVDYVHRDDSNADADSDEEEDTDEEEDSDDDFDKGNPKAKAPRQPQPVQPAPQPATLPEFGRSRMQEITEDNASLKQRIAELEREMRAHREAFGAGPEGRRTNGTPAPPPAPPRGRPAPLRGPPAPPPAQPPPPPPDEDKDEDAFAQAPRLWAPPRQPPEWGVPPPAPPPAPPRGPPAPRHAPYRGEGVPPASAPRGSH